MQKISLLVFCFFLWSKSFTQDIRMLDKVRGSRYCELLVVKGHIGNLTATVHNTLGCNNCPDAAWRKLSATKLKKELAAKRVLMNGPRYFMMDKIGQSNAPKPKQDFDGLDMVERASLKVSLSMMRGKNHPYTEKTIHRSTEYVFNKGSEVYELVSPSHTYVMQSYALIVDSTLTESELPNLAAKLKLPLGWQYRVLKLSDDLILKTLESAEAFVIQDELDNTYQRIH